SRSGCSIYASHSSVHCGRLRLGLSTLPGALEFGSAGGARSPCHVDFGFAGGARSACWGAALVELAPYPNLRIRDLRRVDKPKRIHQLYPAVNYLRLIMVCVVALAVSMVLALA